MKKNIIVEYTNDPETSILVGRAVSNDFNVAGAITQADDLDGLKARMPETIDLILAHHGSADRFVNANVVYQYVPHCDFIK
jgi:hypothetical protein